MTHQQYKPTSTFNLIIPYVKFKEYVFLVLNT